jgi:ATP-binding cassette subfamily B protein
MPDGDQEPADRQPSNEAPTTIYSVFDSESAAKVKLRALPTLTLEGLRVVWAAGRSDLLLLLALQVVGGLGLAIQLLLGATALDALLTASSAGRPLSSVLGWAVVIAGVSAALMFAATVRRERQQLLGEVVQRHVERCVLDVSTVVGLEAFEEPSFHNRLQRVRMSSHQPLNIVFGVSGLVAAIVGTVSVIAALAAIEPLLIPLVTVVLVPAWLAASRRSEAFFRLLWRLTPRDRERQYIASVLSDRESAAEVRSFSLPGYLRSRHDRLYDERIGELRRVARRQTIYALIANAGIGVVLGGTLVLVAWLTLSDRVALAEAGIAVAGVGLVGARLTEAGYSAGSLAEATLYLDDYRAFLALEPEARAARPTAAAPPGFRRLSVNDVSFTYPSDHKRALDGVTLQIAAGEVVALVGENGSGKTTLAKLLAGLYRPDKGTICWNDADVGAVDPDDLRRSVAVIFQDFLRYHLPARDNIGLGRHEHIGDLPRIHAAAADADADAFLRALRAGYDTMLGPEFHGGTDLSIGQWQRVALARAFFRDAPFVILDEPTAALDARAESELFARLRTLLRGRTVLLISHRFSSVRTADRIYVLDAGRVVEAGTHEELVDLGGRYAELFAFQAAAYRDGRPAGPSHSTGQGSMS